MYGKARTQHRIRAAIVVAAVTLMALAMPVAAPLYAEVYPLPPDTGNPPSEPGPDSFKQALTDANVEGKFESPAVTQFETTSFRATVVYGTPIDPNLPRVKIAWSNEAELTAPEEGTFDIEPTSTSRVYLDAGARRPGGGYELSWTWDVTPLVAGDQSLELHIVPSVLINGITVPDAASVNQPIPVEVDVHPVQRSFDEVLSSAESMEPDVPAEMTVGEEHDVSASMSLAGHEDTVKADIELSPGDGSAAVTIVEVTAAGPATRNVSSASDDDRLVRRWTVTPDEPGQVLLVFTAAVKSQVETHQLRADVPISTSARAQAPGASVWQILQRPVQYLTPFVAFAVAVLGLWAAWNKRKASAKGAPEPNPENSDDAAAP